MNDTHHFCTIITCSHLGYAFALLDSLQQHATRPIHIHVLVVDPISFEVAPPSNCEILTLSDIQDSVAPFIAKYSDVRSALRWALKPVLLLYLLEERGLDRCVYLDWDLCFYNTYDFIFDALKNSALFLTPHFRAEIPQIDSTSFLTTLQDGFFNAGLIGSSRLGVPALRWWRDVNLFACERSEKYHLFVDQRYLDMLPVLFANIYINRHKGLNVGTWHHNPNFIIRENVLYIDSDPIVFIHFAEESILAIEQSDYPPLQQWAPLKPYLDEYKSFLSKYAHLIASQKSRWQTMAEAQLRWINQLEKQQADLWHTVEEERAERVQWQQQHSDLQQQHNDLQQQHGTLQQQFTLLRIEHQNFRSYYRSLEGRSLLGYLRKIKRWSWKIRR